MLSIHPVAVISSPFDLSGIEENQESPVILKTISESDIGDRMLFLKGLPLPPLDKHVLNALKEYKSHSVWDALVTNISNFYMLQYPDRMKNQTDYRQVGEDLYLRYPALKRNGAKPWTHLMACVSTKLRNDRLRRKRKSQDKQLGETPKALKRVDIEVPVNSSISTLTEDDYKEHNKMMAQEMMKSYVKRDDSHLKILLKETHAHRRNKIKFDPNYNTKCIMADLIQEVPCLKSADFLWEEFRLTVGKSDDEMKEMMDCFDKLMEQIEKSLPVAKHENGELRVPNLLKTLEDKIGFHSGKGAKSKSFISIHGDTSEIKTKTNSSKGDCPHLHLFVNDDDDELIDLAVISGDGTTIAIPDDFTITKACMSVLACYYVFDIDYPRVYAMLLGFLQQVILGHPFTSSKKNKAFYSEVARYHNE